MKYTRIIFSFSLFLFFLSSGEINAQERGLGGFDSGRGIGVSPAKIEIGEVSEWPYTVPVFVTNFSAETEFFEIVFEADDTSFISINPGRFPLESGEQKQVLLAFDNPVVESSGIIKISGTRISPEGFVTGTGIEVPFYVLSRSPVAGQLESESEIDAFAFSAAVGEYLALGSWHGRMWGGVAILMSIVFLLFLSMRVSKYLYEFSIG